MIKRFVSSSIINALKDNPVVLVHGARQTGKSTLIKKIVEEEYPAQYVTLDDPGMLAAAKNSPDGFLEGMGEILAIDEVQHVPELFRAIKVRVDKNRKPGQYILTGSSNVFLLPKISESLAGRMEVLTLYPFSRTEINNSAHPIIDELFSKNYQKPTIGKNIDSLSKRIVTGGYPEILRRQNLDRREAWFNSYITTILQRDVRDISNIEGLMQIPKLLRIFASRAGTLLNFAEISRAATISQTTLKRYIALLEAIFLIRFLPAWSGNLSKRLIKTPKLYFNDTGLLSYLVGFDENSLFDNSLFWGRAVENFVLMELIKNASWSKSKPQISYFRTASGREVDFILEKRDGTVIGVEVKATANPTAEMFSGLKILKEEIGKKFLRGFIFYSGREIIPFDRDMYAMPIDVLE